MPGKFDLVFSSHRAGLRVTNEQPGWVGVVAVAWVIDHAPVPAELAWTLLVIARRCDEHGRGSYQSVPTIAAKAGKSADQVRRDIAELRALGLLILGDQSRVDHLPAGQRPTVYDVPLYVRGPKPARASRNKSGGKKEAEGGSGGGTPCMDATPGMGAGGGMEAESTPGMDARSTPGMDATQTTQLINHVEQPSLSLAAAEGRPAEDQERDRDVPSPATQTKLRLLAEHGARDRDEAVSLLTEVERVKPYGLGWWRKVAGNGDLAAIVIDARGRVAVAADVSADGYGGPTHEYEHSPSRCCAVCELPENNRRHRPRSKAA